MSTSVVMKSLLRLLIAVAAALTSCIADEDPSLEVLTFNVRYANKADGANYWEHRVKFVAEVMLAKKADIIGVQEALRSQLDDLKPQLGGYAELGAGREDGKTKGEYSALLYRTAVLEPLASGTFWLSDTPAVPSLNWGAKLERICTWARFRHRESGREFYVFNSHWDHQSVEGRRRGAELLAARIRDRKPSAPVILTGDFNCGENDSALAPLRAGGLRDSYRVLHPDAKDAGTFHGWKGTTTGDKIDYILCDASVTPIEAEIIRTSRDGRLPSDHFPVRAKLRIAK
jgi:endonuclease/exonuclease/phosphatase family metal-dependent hydrolase